jgi:magnesium-transporting ATPase (P-type)
VSINRTAYFVAAEVVQTIIDAPSSKSATGKYSVVVVSNDKEESKKGEGSLRDPVRLPVVGSKTEGAMMYMVHDWGFDCEVSKTRLFNTSHDKVFPFNSVKKRSSAVVHLPNGTIRLYTKGASELLLKDCTKVFDAATGQTKPLTPEVNAQLEKKISDMADAALRTLVLAHRDFPSEEAMPPNWATCPPELDMDMVCDCIVGIQDPLRPDVTAAVATARRAGVVVRMVTGDNIQTAKAIARQCGILTEGGR